VRTLRFERPRVDILYEICMMHHVWKAGRFAVFSLLVLSMRSARTVAEDPAAAPPAAERALVSEAYGKLPLSFVANTGQTDASVKFISRGPGYSLFLKAQEAMIVVSKSAAPNQDTRESSVIRMRLQGANPEPEVAGVDELPGKVNYFLGNDPEKWRTDVPTYAKVQYSSVYPGIDMVYYGKGQQLEYDFVVAPGADPAAIRLGFEGNRRIHIDGTGNLVLGADDAEFRLLKPVVYQSVQGNRQEVAGEYVLVDQNQVAVKLGAYDVREPLVIDPILVYSTYLGGTQMEEGFAIAVDSSGNAYVAGRTFSTNFPTSSPFQASYAQGSDAFVTKFNPTGTAMIYSTYFGGASFEDGHGIVIDGSGNAYVAGQTMSSNFPTVNPYQATLGDSLGDAFVTKLNATGSALIYSTYLGGTNLDRAFKVAVDGSGNSYLTGYTQSNNFPISNAFQTTYRGGYSAFVTKFNAAGSALVYSTYLGGAGENYGYAIAADPSGNAYVTGSTSSADFPTVNAIQPVTNCIRFNPPRCTPVDAFVTKFSAGGSVVYSTYLGGSNHDEGFGIVADGSGNAYVTGGAYYWGNFPIVTGAFQANHSGASNTFVTKFNAGGSALIYSTFLGGGEGHGIALDSSGNAYVAGKTGGDLPSTNPIQPNHAGGFYDAFVTKLNAAGSALFYSTYIGGAEQDWANGIAVDSSGSAYVTGRTVSQNFPTANAPLVRHPVL
jgi:hypothetical protein